MGRKPGENVDAILAHYADKAIWVDRYEGAPAEMSCGWYLADLIDGRWQFTAYADIDCAAHGLV